MEADKLGKSMIKTIKTTPIEGLSAGVGEMVIDSVLEDGLFKDIPIVGAVINSFKLVKDVRNYTFLKKVARFLFEIKDIPTEKRNKFINKVENEEKYNKKVGLALILLLEKIDDLEKPEIIGKLFIKLIDGEINYNTFLKLSNIVSNIFLPDISELKKFEKEEIDDDIESDLYRVGLLGRTPFGEMQFNGQNEYYLNNHGKYLLKIIFEDE